MLTRTLCAGGTSRNQRKMAVTKGQKDPKNPIIPVAPAEGG